MITDAHLQVSTNQGPITADAVSTSSIVVAEEYYDAAGVLQTRRPRDIGEGRELYMVLTVTTAFTGAGTIAFQVIGDSLEALSSSPRTILGQSNAIVASTLTAGSKVFVRINTSLASTGHKYIGAHYDVTGTVGAGKVTADVVLDIQDGKKFYPSGFSTNFVGIP